MGAESSMFEECDLEEPSKETNIWTVRHGRFNDEIDVTVLSSNKGDKQNWGLLQKNIKFLKSFRHPYIVKYLNMTELSHDLHLIIERSTPLPCLLETLDPMEISAGIYNIIDGLSFLHEKAGVCHNNICPESIYVTDTGGWKIGRFEHACKFLDVTPDFLKTSQRFRNKDFISPEEKDEKLVVTMEMGHTRDVYSFGILADNLLEYLSDLGDMTKTFDLHVHDACLHPDPKQRPKMKMLLSDQLFRNDLLSITRFLREITLKSGKEKEEFFRDVTDKLVSLPEDVVGKQLSHLLLCRFVLLDQSAKMTIIPNILIPKRDADHMESHHVSPLFSVPLFKKFVIPELFKVFHCHDYHIRMVLLTYFSYYVDLFDKQDLEEVIFPQVLIGIRDKNEDLAALSLHALADMVSILGRDAIIGGKSKEYFTKGTPKLEDVMSVYHLIIYCMAENLFYVSNQYLYTLEQVSDCLAEDTGNTKGTLEKILLKDLAKVRPEHQKVQSGSIPDPNQRRLEKQAKQKQSRLQREQRKIQNENKRQERKNISNSTFTSEDQVKNTKVDVDTIEIIPTRREEDKLSSETDTMQYKPYDVQVSKSWREDFVEPDVFVTGDNSDDDWSDWDNDIKDNLSTGNQDEKLKQNGESHPTHSVNPELSYRTDDVQHVNSYLQGSLKHSYTEDSENDNRKLTFTSKNAMKLSKSKKATLQQKVEEKSLGSEFEIKKITDEVKQTEIDFFADMAPVFQKSTTSKDKGLENISSSKTDSKTGHTFSALSYSFEGSGQETDGWGDDLDWAEED